VSQGTIRGSAEIVAILTAEKLRTASAFVVAPVEEAANLVTERSAGDALVPLTSGPA
jgi:hypothetical protein